MSYFEDILKGGDLRSIGKADQVAAQVNDQKTFDDLFRELYNPDRIVVMRAADAIEKITISKYNYLGKHKNDIITLCSDAKDIELKWHLALLVPRLKLSGHEAKKVWKIFTRWATDKDESKIVRTNAIQGLYDILQYNKKLTSDFDAILKQVGQENIASISARIRKITNSRPK